VIVVKQKPADEICEMVAGHRRVLLVGCNTCAAVALAGGAKEVETLAELLKLAMYRRGATIEFGGCVLQRQCEPEFLEQLENDRYDAILSLGCGAGVALLAETAGVPVFPALDTLFIGSSRGFANWRAECSACGSCVLGKTAGICPVTRCAKGIMNGPCGGVKDGMCELGDRPCAWVQIYERLEARGCAEDFDETIPPKDASLRTKWNELDLSRKNGAR
jgi:hypothetical protein